MFKISKVKGGKVKLYSMLKKSMKSIKGKGTPAVLKNYDDVDDQLQFNNLQITNKSGGSMNSRSKRSIKPLVFKL